MLSKAGSDTKLLLLSVMIFLFCLKLVATLVSFLSETGREERKTREEIKREKWARLKEGGREEEERQQLGIMILTKWIVRLN